MTQLLLLFLVIALGVWAIKRYTRTLRDDDSDCE